MPTAKNVLPTTIMDNSLVTGVKCRARMSRF